MALNPVKKFKVQKTLFGRFRVECDCPHCSEGLYLKESELLEDIWCPKCGISFQIKSSASDEISERRDADKRKKEEKRQEASRKAWPSAEALNEVRQVLQTEPQPKEDPLQTSRQFKYLFFDAETTGLPGDRDAPMNDVENWPRLVQLAWIRSDERGHGEGFSYVIKPEGFGIPQDAVNYHGITNERAAVEGHEVRAVLEEFVHGVESAEILVAHNMDFDINVVGAELIRAGIGDVLSRKQTVCTMKGSTDFCRLPSDYDSSYKWPRLQELHFILFGEEFEGEHDAIKDAEACFKSFFRLNQLQVVRQCSDGRIDTSRSSTERTNSRATHCHFCDRPLERGGGTVQKVPSSKGNPIPRTVCPSCYGCVSLVWDDVQQQREHEQKEEELGKILAFVLIIVFVIFVFIMAAIEGK